MSNIFDQICYNVVMQCFVHLVHQKFYTFLTSKVRQPPLTA